MHIHRVKISGCKVGHHWSNMNSACRHDPSCKICSLTVYSNSYRMSLSHGNNNNNSRCSNKQSKFQFGTHLHNCWKCYSSVLPQQHALHMHHFIAEVFYVLLPSNADEFMLWQILHPCSTQDVSLQEFPNSLRICM